jgi:hypothetical protein
MATTFLFEELDEQTRDYLTAVRDSEGAGSPGVFAPTSDSLPGCGCIAGPIVVLVTLLLTLTTWLDLIFVDPVRLAMLQTAGLVLGGWLLMAKFRAGAGNKNAGTWVYVDPLYLYEAFREQVTVTPIDEVADASYTHNYDSNGNYQNSVVNIVLGGNGFVAVTLSNEGRAEQMVTFLNYLAWARGSDGGDRAELAPAELGGLARYVVRNGDEPKDAENNINLRLIELDIDTVPEQPAREGRAVPNLIPYVLLLIFGVVCFLAMAYVVNPPLRDDAIYDAVMKDNLSMTEPRFLRAYLTDPRNTRHREKVTQRLAQFYNEPINHVQNSATDRVLGEGMVAILKSLSTAEQPVVSIRVTEIKSPPGKDDSKSARENALRTAFATGVNAAFAAQPWGMPISPPPGEVFKEQPPPKGHQLIAFVEPPEDAKGFHFDVGYEIDALPNNTYRVRLKAELRADIEDANPARSTFAVDVPATELDSMNKVADEMVEKMIGKTFRPMNQPPQGQPPFGQPGQPPFGQPGQPRPGQPGIGQPGQPFQPGGKF